MKNEKTKIKLNFEEFLKEILTSPARLHECYNFFYNYSHRNKLLAMFQMDKPEPINTYKGWQALGRQVKKGAKAICLTMPVTIKDENKDGNEVKKVIYIPKNYWFKLSDTDGEEYSPIAQVPRFNFDLALKNLGIEKIDFEKVNGNMQGYAKPNLKQIAINKLAVNKLKTGLHEIAHCLLHSEESLLNDDVELNKSIKEFEAESVAYIIISQLGLEGLEYSRGYIKSWIGQDGNKADLTEKNFNRILGACDKILKAGSIQLDNQQ